MIGAGAMLGPTANAIDLKISIGDRPYYEDRAEFWDWGWHWVWVPGHWEYHPKRWVHGYYERVGDWNIRFVKHRHRWHKHKHHKHHDD